MAVGALERGLVESGVSGVLMSFLGHMEWVYGSMLGGLGKFSSHARFEVGDGFKVGFIHCFLVCQNIH